MSVKQNIVIEAGATFKQTSTLTDSSNNLINTANCTVVAQIRKSYYSLNSVPIVATVNNSILTLGIDANTTLSIYPGRYVYDVKMNRADGTIDRLLEGIATVTPDVTR